MQKFKLIFHIFYIAIALLIMYFSVDILLNTEQYLSKVKLSSYIKFPRYVMGLFLFLSVMMVIEFLIQQTKTQSTKRSISKMKKEITDLKAKLYDKVQEEPTLELPEETKADESEDSEEDSDAIS